MSNQEARSSNNAKRRSVLVRHRILDAALRCYQTQSVAKVRLIDIAVEAKMTRATVYRYFQDKQEILVAAILKTLQTLLAEINDRLRQEESFAEFSVETIASIFNEMPRKPLFDVVPKSYLLTVVADDIGKQDLLSIMGEHFRPRFNAARLNNEFRDGVEFEQFMSWVLHVVLSYTTMPTLRSNSTGFRNMLWQFFIPSLIHSENRKAASRGLHCEN